MPTPIDERLLVAYLGCQHVLRYPEVAGPQLCLWARRELTYFNAILDHRPDLRAQLNILQMMEGLQ